MKRSLIDLKEYFNRISRNDKLFIVAIDGLGASGKTVFAKKLKAVLNNCQILQLDDFYIPMSDPLVTGSNFDWQRLTIQVLEPLKNKDRVKYQVYDWNKNELCDWKAINKEDFLIIEGVTSGRYELQKYLDFLIFIDAPFEIRLSRGIERDGINAKEIWLNDWMPRELRYLESKLHQPKENANIIIDGTYENKDDFNEINTLKEEGEYFA